MSTSTPPKSKTARKAPAFQLYVDDFLAGTIDMSNEEVGVYIRLLCIQWSKGAVSQRSVNSIGSGEAVAYVLGEKFVSTDAGWINPRLEDVRRLSIERAKNGRKGASTTNGRRFDAVDEVADDAAKQSGRPSDDNLDSLPAKQSANLSATDAANLPAKQSASGAANASANGRPPTPTPTPTPTPSPAPNPNPASSQARLLGGERASGLAMDDFLRVTEQSELDEIRLQASKFLRTHERTVGRENCWRIAWVAWCVERGLLSEILGRMSKPGRSIDNHLKYIHGALRSELTKLGHDLAQCLAAVPPPPPEKQT